MPLPLKKLEPIHERLAFMLASGTKPAEAAEACGVSKGYLFNLKGDPLFQEAVRRYQEQIAEGRVQAVVQTDIEAMVRDRLGQEALKTIEKLVELRDNAKSPQAQIKACQLILEYAGLKPAEKVEQTTKVVADEKVAKDIEAAVRDLERLAQLGA